ncbi:hypothetical protein NLI96_g1662 [Meripilus lineatus]|uniref:Hydrophobin n=1 Tax=Meripilus lineatus TaxID=2056292 RepID=A0AAD5VCH3_9APHY|nr:hypothetical protein NLI96_g1662 [Physisporinus lineatus]
MFSRTYTTILSAIFFLVVLVAAHPAPAPWGGNVPTQTVTVTVPATPTGGAGSGGNCNTGPIQCCNQVQEANAGGPLTTLLNLLGIVISPLNALVGSDCSPINVIGAGQSSCSATPICCTNNNVGGLISIGCIPIILG